MTYINTPTKLTTLTTITNDDWILKAQMTTEQNIILNATLMCIGSISGDMANSERIVRWLASCGIEGTICDKHSNRVNIPFAFKLADDESDQSIINIRLGKRTVGGRWFIYATCIGELGLPVNVTKQAQKRTDIQDIQDSEIFTKEWLDS
jgi:hypothetical protein